MKYKVGKILYRVDYTEHPTVITFKMEYWVVRTIRGGMVTAILKNKWTWVKRSTTNGDWGWADSISKDFRQTIPEGREFATLCALRPSAWRSVRACVEAWVDEGPLKVAALNLIKRKLAR